MDNKKIVMECDEKTAELVDIINILNECGVISFEQENKLVHGLWEKLTTADKRFVYGMIQGTVMAMSAETCVNSEFQKGGR